MFVRSIVNRQEPMHLRHFLAHIIFRDKNAIKMETN